MNLSANSTTKSTFHSKNQNLVILLVKKCCPKYSNTLQKNYLNKRKRINQIFLQVSKDISEQELNKGQFSHLLLLLFTFQIFGDSLWGGIQHHGVMRR